MSCCAMLRGLLLWHLEALCDCVWLPVGHVCVHTESASSQIHPPSNVVTVCVFVGHIVGCVSAVRAQHCGAGPQGEP